MGMAFPTKGTRKIVVDGEVYLWRSRVKPLNARLSGATLAVQRVSTGEVQSDVVYPLEPEHLRFTPGDVERFIRERFLGQRCTR